MALDNCVDATIDSDTETQFFTYTAPQPDAQTPIMHPPIKDTPSQHISTQNTVHSPISHSHRTLLSQNTEQKQNTRNTEHKENTQNTEHQQNTQNTEHCGTATPHSQNTVPQPHHNTQSHKQRTTPTHKQIQKRQKQEIDDLDCQLQEQLDQLRSARSLEVPQDNCHAWGMMMAAELRSYEGARQRAFKAKIARVVMEMNEEDALLT